jgi:hypothetical protein
MDMSSFRRHRGEAAGALIVPVARARAVKGLEGGVVEMQSAGEAAGALSGAGRPLWVTVPPWQSRVHFQRAVAGVERGLVGATWMERR